MARPTTLRSALAALAALVIAGLSAAGCVSMPTGGPVQSYPVTQGTDAQSQQYMQIQPQPPGSGWDPTQIVDGFLTASASFGNYGKIVLQYLTPQEQQNWKTAWSAYVYKVGPYAGTTSYPNQKNPTTAIVPVTGTVQAILTGRGSYSVPSASSKGAQSSSAGAIKLRKVDGQWRISYAPPELLLTSNSFGRDFQLQNLYFFDSTGHYLVADPVYVPLAASPEELVNGLVSDLISPPGDWLSDDGATRTAFPPGTKISKSNGINVNGVTAVVNLTGTDITKANSHIMEQVSAQLLSTLKGAAQGGPNGLQSVEILLNGNPWDPPNNPGSPVQHRSEYGAPNGDWGNEFYCVDSSGYLTSDTSDGSPHRLAKIGTGYGQIAISPDQKYVAALRGTTLYAGIIGDPLGKLGSGYMAISWDTSDDLWASGGDGSRIVMFRGPVGVRQPFGQQVPVTVVPNPNSTNLLTPPYTELKVAPDGVRIAIVAGGDILTFGAISGLQGANPQISLSTVQENPPSQSGTFKTLAWYGSGDVITLAQPGSALTEYPVSGGGSTSIPTDPLIQTVAASFDRNLIAGLSGLPKGQLDSDASLSASWMPLDPRGTDPSYPG